MRERWLEGVWIGKRWNSEEHLIACDDGRVVRARSVHVFPEEKRWDAEAIKGKNTELKATIKKDQDRMHALNAWLKFT